MVVSCPHYSLLESPRVYYVYLPSVLHVLSCPPQMSTSSSSSSVPSLDASVTSSATNQSQQSARKTPESALQQKPDAGSPYITPDFYIIRVTIRTSAHETEGINLYKSIMLSNSERTPQVIRNAMIKHDLEGNTDDFVLAQLLPDAGEHGVGAPPGSRPAGRAQHVGGRQLPVRRGALPNV